MPKRDEFHKYEVVDRAHSVFVLLGELLGEHPMIECEPELRAVRALQRSREEIPVTGSNTPRQLLTRVQIEAWRAWYHDGAGTMLPAGTFDDLCDTALLLGETQQSETTRTMEGPHSLLNVRRQGNPGASGPEHSAGSSASAPSSDKLQRYTFERAGDGYQFTTTDDGLWVMAKDVERLERELAEAHREIQKICQQQADADAERDALKSATTESATAEAIARLLEQRAHHCDRRECEGATIHAATALRDAAGDIRCQYVSREVK